jgi:hypothetical protein
MDRGAILAVAVPLIAFKIWFAILLLTYAPTRDGAVWIAATHWPLLIIIGLLAAGPGVGVWRLVRARARRKRLQDAEWMTRDSRRPQSQWSLWETVSRLEGPD